MSVAASWSVIEEWLAENAPEIRKSLRPPADMEKVNKLQKRLGLTLPADFVESVLIHDGQKSDTEHGVVPSPSGDEFEPSYLLFTLTDIGREWTMMKELLEMGQFEGTELPPSTPGVQHVHWSLGWVPILHNGGGDYFCLDLAPAEGGTVGQVIVYGHEGTGRKRAALSFAELLSKLAGQCEAGKITFDEDTGLVES